MVQIESAWPKYPDYEINLVRDGTVARAWFGDLLLAESRNAIRLEETKHVDRLYFPVEDVNWEHFTPSLNFTICPFKGAATYWSLTAIDPVEKDIVWTYSDPFDEVGGIEGYVAFYQERVRIELEDHWPGDAPHVVVTNQFPAWGAAADLLQLIDVTPTEQAGRFVGAPYRDTTRNVVEGGQMLAQGIVAASKTLPRQRVTQASMLFPKAAAFDAPLDLVVDVLREGRTFSTAEVRISQHDKLRSVGLFLLDAGAPDVIDGSVPMPDVAGPADSEPYDMKVTGRELRIVNGDYRPDPDHIGPPALYAWIRFRDAPSEPYLHAALMAQPTTHWTIAAAMLPHPGFGEAQAHVTLSTGIMGVTMAFHDDVDVTQWLLYSNPAIHAGRGLVQGEGHVFTEDGRLVASYTVQGMVRDFVQGPEAMGHNASTAM
jgi:acyl-CoA thioesterase II